MSLQIWLPLNGNLKNNGIKHYDIATLGTVSWPAEGKIGKCFQGGTGTKVANGISLNSNLTDILSNDYSIAVWIKPLGTHVHYNGAIISSGNWNQKTWSFGVSQDNTKVDVLSNRYNIYIDCPIPVNVWTHLVCIRKDNVIKLYKNGEYIDSLSGSVPSATLQSDADNTTIGRQTYANGYFSFNGCINDLRIYDNALSQQQIKKISRGLILHYPLNRQCWGQENLLKASNVLVTNRNYRIQSYYFGDNPPQAGEQVTVQIKGHLADTKSYWGVYNSGGTVLCLIIQKNTYNENTGIYTMTGEWKTQKNTTAAANTHINVYAFTSSQSGESTIEWIKLERGNKATPWCPNAADDIYTTLDLGNNIQYDISGYQNNGTKYNITYDSDTPKYDVSSVFTSVDTSYIKVNENNWIPQYQEAMTINLFAYSTNWAQTTKLFSCLQSGGFGTNVSNISGYTRISVYVATNEQRTNHGYKHNDQELKISDLSAGWHMLTFIYDSTGNKVYVDGQLHSSYAFTSYGIKYDTNARLFLGCEAASASPTAPYLNGKISDFRLYATAFSAEDVLSLYNDKVDFSSSDIVGEGLVGYMILKQ